METTDARHALLARLIDHAPMFPPASLSPAGALAEDARAGASPQAFMLARLVWPASALGEVSSYERALSVVLDAPVAEDARIEAVEARPEFDLASGASGMPSSVREIYVETPLDDGLEARLDRIAEHGFRAKVRCGGAEVPSPDALARFVRACRERGLAFKATAGLHHAVRGDVEHGFLNLLAATAFERDEEAALEETDADAFSLDASAFRWRGRSAPAEDIARVRRELFHSIGSCSFFEPVEELEARGMLPS
ncbi:MAG TPA: hypothetical protein VEW90_01360 [Gaiellaceae bacterium]|jgi:hypothetical protein|nr:hypothetical protein [Gaiellaceae bacterium]